MSLNGFCKRNFYWIQDFLHGSKVRKHYNEIKTEIINNEINEKHNLSTGKKL